MKKLVSLFVFATFFVAANVNAQSFDIAANANVIAAVTVTPGDLEFGNVTPDIAKSIDKAVADAGNFDFVGSATAGVDLTFTLPSNLTSATAGGATMPISFSATDAGWDADGTPGTLTAFDPNSTYTGASFDGSGFLYVYIGGTVTPGSSQAAASDYTATISLEVSYQ